MAQMINPHLIEPMYGRIKNRRIKIYLAGFRFNGQVRYCRRFQSKTASRAKNHAELVHRRWVRLYDAKIAILAMEAAAAAKAQLAPQEDPDEDGRDEEPAGGW